MFAFDDQADFFFPGYLSIAESRGVYMSEQVHYNIIYHFFFMPFGLSTSIDIIFKR